MPAAAWLMNLGFAGGVASVAVAGPFRVVARQTYSPGAREAEVFNPGPAAREVFSPGTAQAEGNP